MDAPLAALYGRVKDRITRAEFEAKVREAGAQFGGLLDEEALGLLVLDELGLNEGAYVTLADLRGRAEATVRVRVERIEPARTFEREGRDPGRVANVVVSDATGESRVVFWDKDVERVDELWSGAHVTLVNARVKEGRFGAELHVGPWTALEVEGALDPAKRKLLADVATEPERAERRTTQTQLLPTELEGRLAWIGQTRPIRKPDGGTGFLCEFDVETADGLRRVVLGDDLVREARALPLGTPILLTALAARVKGATTEWHATPGTLLERR